MVFGNAHLMLNHKNKLAIIATHKETSPYLHIFNSNIQEAPEETSDDPNSQTDKDGKFELFSRVNNGVMEQIKEVFMLGNISCYCCLVFYFLHDDVGYPTMGNGRKFFEQKPES